MSESEGSRYLGVILGTALGDAVGLPYEGLPPARAARLFPGPVRPRFVGGRLMVSDDTEHTLMVAQALLAHPADPEAFARSLAWKIRGWLLALPAGVGFATLRAGLKLCVGVPPTRSGVYSAGNGPAMRSAILGIALRQDLDRLTAYVRASTRLTHTDPRAERGALAVALAAAWAADDVPMDEIVALLKAHFNHVDTELDAVFDRVLQGSLPESPQGVTGYVYRTLEAALACWLLFPQSFEEAVTAAIRLGGDTDTVAAIVGALCGAAGARLPVDWLNALWEWPRSRAWMTRVGERLEATFEKGTPAPPLALAWPVIPVRNAVFLFLVLGHGFRRLLPPY